MSEDDNPPENEPQGQSQNKGRLNKIQIRPGRAMESVPDQQLGNYLSNLPTISKEPGSYIPMPYIFRLSSLKSEINDLKFIIKMVPFHLLLDHTIAVIWLTLSEKDYTAPLGIVQLQWANEFLKTIFNEKGEHPKDIQFCIDTIERLLLEEYSDLNKELDKLENAKKNLQNNGITNVAIVKNVPFSLNYCDMIEKVPEASSKEFEMKLKQSTMTQDEIDIEIENIRKAQETSDTKSKYERINFLRAYKNNQLDKIRNDVQKLMSVQELMGSMGFEDENTTNVVNILNKI